jgi:hypothetical protein
MEISLRHRFSRNDHYLGAGSGTLWNAALTHEGSNLDSPLRRRALEGMRPDSPRVLDFGDFLMGPARRTSDKASSILALSPNPKRKGGIQHRVSEIRAPTLRRNQIAGTTTLAAMTYRVARPVTELMQPRK